MITNITIKNIKGYDSVGKSMDVTLLPNKINLVIAPNEFGKTSLTTAFEALNANSLAVKDEDKYQENPLLHPFLSVTEDGTTYSAAPFKLKCNVLTPIAKRPLTYSVASSKLINNDK